MKTFKDLETDLDMTLPHVRKFTAIVYPGEKVFTEEQVERLISIRGEMKTGEKLSWKQIESKYGVKKEAKTKEQPTSESLDSLAQQTLEQSLPQLQKKIHEVGGQVVASMVVKHMNNIMEKVPFMAISAALYAVQQNDELMSESLDIVNQAIDAEPTGDFSSIEESIAGLIDSSYEQGKQITSKSYGDQRFIEAVEEEDSE